MCGLLAGYYAKYSLADNYSAPDKSLAVVKLVRAFRQYGHSIARLDPLGLAAMPKQFRPTFGRLFDSMDAAAKATAGPALLDFSGFPGLAGVDQVGFEHVQCQQILCVLTNPATGRPLQPGV